MSLKYACFLSYRRIKSRAYKNIVREVYEQLNDELSFILELDKPVYCPDLDWLQDKKDSPEECRDDGAKALCESACMVLLYTPRYFRSEDCYLEYITMCTLEEKRVQLFTSPLQQKLRLIIPVILRGSKNLPDDIKVNRESVYMDRVSTSEVDRLTIIRLAEYISERYEAFQNEFDRQKSLEKQNFDCGDFKFPLLDHKEFNSWREKSEGKFPGYGLA